MTPDELKIEEDRKWCKDRLQETNNRIAVLEFSLKEMLKLVFESKEDANICISTCEDLAEQTIKDLAELFGTRKFYIEKLEKLDVWKGGE